MKTKSTPLVLVIIFLTTFNLSAQVPNGGFETWTNGSPDNWYNTNIPTIVTNITQETPSYSGTYAVKGEVINYSGSPYSPLLSSVDMSFNGFPISQSYANFSFYYKLNITSTARFEASITFYDAGGNWVASGGNFLTGSVNSYTLVNFPMNYGSANPPVEAIIIFAIQDTVATDPPIGNYFIVDGVTLSGSVGVEEQSSENYFASAFPNPARDFVSIALDNAENGSAEIFLHDMKGSLVKKFITQVTANNFELKLSVADLPRGIYTLRAVSGKKHWIARFTKQ